jgi:hypothetical protein
MLIPSYETYKRMAGSHAGVWPESVNENSNVELAVKVSADLAKAILKGAAVTLLANVIEVSGESVRVVGLRIEDDQNDPAFIHQPQERATEQAHFDALLQKRTTWITFFDELVRPVMTAKVSWSAKAARAAADYLCQSAPHYEGDNRAILEEAMDTATDSISGWHKAENSNAARGWKAIPLTLQNLQPLIVVSPEAGTFVVDHSDEGGDLEKSAYLLFEANYPGQAYLNPQVNDGSRKRELCDVLVVGDNQMLVIQSKVTAVLQRSLSQVTERRVANVMANFRKALSQLSGAIRNLRRGSVIYTSEGKEIPTKKEITYAFHGVILLSSTNLALPWTELSKELITTSHKSRAPFHVLEFAELQQHVAFAKTVNHVTRWLAERFELLEKSRNANVVARFLTEENRPITSPPLRDSDVGYVFTFQIQGKDKVDGGRIMKAFTTALKSEAFTGRCEYFYDFGVLGGEKILWIALGLRWDRAQDQIPSHSWWTAFAKRVDGELHETGVVLSELSEIATLAEIRATKTLAVVVEFRQGKATGFEDPDNPFELSG